MPPEMLGVDPVSLSGFSNDMLSAVGDIPQAPPPFTTTGADPISRRSWAPQFSSGLKSGLAGQTLRYRRQFRAASFAQVVAGSG